MSAILSIKKLPSTNIIRNGFIGISIASIANGLLYLFSTTFTFPPDAITPMGDPVTLIHVLVSTLIGGLGAILVYFLLTRFLTQPTGRRVMWVLTVLVLIGGFYGPFDIKNVPVSEIVVLEIMHLVAGLAPVYLLTK